MRRLLNGLYKGCGVLSAAFIVCIALAILAEIIGRMAGVLIPAATEFAGYCLASAIFLGLAYTLTSGEHIRVSILLLRVPARARHAFEVFCLVLGTALSIYFAWHFCAFAYETFVFGEVGQGLIKTPLWIPQSGLALGLVVLAIAFVDELVTMLSGRTPQYLEREGDEAARVLRTGGES